MKEENIHYIGSMFSKICTDIMVKCWAVVSYSIFSFFFDENKVASLVALLFLILFDFITGIIAAKKTRHEIKSAKVFRTALKILFYFMMVAAGHIVETIIGINFFIDETVLIVLAVTEFISIMENTGKIGFAIPNKLLNKLEEFRDSK